MKRNILSKDVLKGKRRTRNILLPIIVVFLICFAFLLGYRDALANNRTLLQYLKNQTWWLLTTFTISITVGILAYLINWYSDMVNPKYITWDEDGIKMINKRGNKDLVPWEKVHDIKWAKDVSSKESRNAFILFINDRFFNIRYLNLEIGKELQKAWEEHGGEIKESYKPPGEKYNQIKDR